MLKRQIGFIKYYNYIQMSFIDSNYFWNNVKSRSSYGKEETLYKVHTSSNLAPLGFPTQWV